MKITKQKVLLTTAVCLLPMLCGLLVWNRLPDQIPVHWDAQMQVDGYGTKAVAVFLIPLFMALLNVFVCYALSRGLKGKPQSERAMKITLWAVPVLSVFLNTMVLVNALGTKINVGKIIGIGVCLMFLILGNYMPKYKQNAVMGIRIPWTMKSEENWNRTHRLAGYVWMITSFLMILALLLLPDDYFGTIFTIGIVVMVMVPIVYSYVIYRKAKK